MQSFVNAKAGDDINHRLHNKPYTNADDVSTAGVSKNHYMFLLPQKIFIFPPRLFGESSESF